MPQGDVPPDALTCSPRRNHLKRGSQPARIHPLPDISILESQPTPEFGFDIGVALAPDGRREHEYNEERPHEALSDKPPTSCYEPSPRRYPTKLREPEYGDDVVVYRVKPNGAIAHEGRDVFLSSTLRGEPVGLTGREDGSWKIHYGPLYLGSLSAQGRLTRGRKRRRRAKETNDEIPTIQTT